MSGEQVLIAGRYRLERRVGTGGMGVVWEGWDERLRRKVAVKQLHSQPGLGDAEAELTKLRAMREARITARLDHPHAVPVFDVVEHEGQPCLIMQFLPSTPLSGVLRERGVLSVRETARIGAQVASALAAAHHAGIVHRDVKPGNVLIAEDGTARISDFGISHALGDSTLTATGMVHGTPAYLAPEVALGGESSFASDVFGLGATLYAALEGAPPFGSDSNSIALLHRVAAGRFTPPARGGALTPLLLEMLARTPSARPTMTEAARRLTGLAADAGAEPDTLRFAEATEDDATGSSPVGRPGASSAGTGVPGRPSPDVASGFAPEPARDAAAGLPAPAAVVAPEPGPRPGTAEITRPSRSGTGVGAGAVGADVGAPARVASGGSGGRKPPPTARRVRDDDRSDRPRRRRLLATAIVLVAALLALVVVAFTVVPSLSGRGGVAADQGPAPTSGATEPSAPGTTAAAPSRSATPTPTRRPTSPSPSSPVSTSAAPSSPAPSSPASSSPAPSSPAPSSPAPSSPAPSSPASSSAAPSSPSSSRSTASTSPTSSSKPVGKTPTAGQLEDAVTGYYKVMPGGTDRGWSRLTAAYRARTGGRSSYDRFWGGIDRVSVREVEGEKPDRVKARIRYSFSDGRVETDETSYRLVVDDGTLKINSTRVLSSSTR